MPALIDVEYDEDDEDDEESMTIEEGEAAVVRALDFGAMTIDDLNVDMTTIVDIPSLDEELDAFLDDQIVDMNTEEISTPTTDIQTVEIIASPPNSPSRSELQSPIAIQDQHVTRRSSERLRQRYRRRRLEEEQQSLNEA